MKKIFLFLSLAFLILPASAQTNEDNEIIAVIQKLFESMQRFDTAVVRSCFYGDAKLQTVSPRLKTSVLRTESLDDFLMQIASLKSDTLKLQEKVSAYEVRSDGLIASVWAPYEFLVNGRVRH